jgi:hypothetical protein
VVWKFQCRHHAVPSNFRQEPHVTRGAAARAFFM